MRKSTLRVALCGPPGAGKTSLARKLAGNAVNMIHIPTIGVDTQHTSLFNDTMKLFMWDLSGDPRFDHLTESYIKSTEVIFMCYDANDIYSYQQLYNMYTTKMDLFKNKDICVVALKQDGYTKEWGRELAILIDCNFVSTSSYNNDVRQLITWLRKYDMFHPVDEKYDSVYSSKSTCCIIN